MLHEKYLRGQVFKAQTPDEYNFFSPFLSAKAWNINCFKLTNALLKGNLKLVNIMADVKLQYVSRQVSSLQIYFFRPPPPPHVQVKSTSLFKLFG
jgi:hypothetical protein